MGKMDLGDRTARVTPVQDNKNMHTLILKYFI